MKTEIQYYRRCVESYFESEFSDFSVEDTIKRLVDSNEEGRGAYWRKKVRTVIKLYYSMGKNHMDAAGHLARIFRPRLKTLLSEGLDNEY